MAMASPAIFDISPDRVSHAVLTAAMKVHTELGPGLLESTYAACLQFELTEAGFNSRREVGLPVVYKGVRLDLGYRIDLLVKEPVVVEIKSVDAIGLLINFNVVHLKAA
jgi:GxxExxY protein